MSKFKLKEFLYNQCNMLVDKKLSIYRGQYSFNTILNIVRPTQTIYKDVPIISTMLRAEMKEQT